MSEQRYGAARAYAIEDWRQHPDTVNRLFVGWVTRYAAERGWAPPAFPMRYQPIPLRLGVEEDAEADGTVPLLVECDAADVRCVRVELRMKWIGEPGVYVRQMERINADAAWIAEHHPRIATPFNPWGDRL